MNKLKSMTPAIPPIIAVLAFFIAFFINFGSFINEINKYDRTAYVREIVHYEGSQDDIVWIETLSGEMIQSTSHGFYKKGQRIKINNSDPVLEYITIQYMDSTRNMFIVWIILLAVCCYISHREDQRLKSSKNILTLVKR